MSKYTNGKWTYHQINNNVLVFNKDNYLVKTISVKELNQLIKIGMVKHGTAE